MSLFADLIDSVSDDLEIASGDLAMNRDPRTDVERLIIVLEAVAKASILGPLLASVTPDEDLYHALSRLQCV